MKNSNAVFVFMGIMTFIGMAILKVILSVVIFCYILSSIEASTTIWILYWITLFSDISAGIGYKLIKTPKEEPS